MAKRRTHLSSGPIGPTRGEAALLGVDQWRRSEAAREMVLEKWAEKLSKQEAETLILRCQALGVPAAGRAIDRATIQSCLCFIGALRASAPMVEQVVELMRTQGGSEERKRLLPNLFPPVIIDDETPVPSRARAGEAVLDLKRALDAALELVEPMSGSLQSWLRESTEREYAPELAFAAALKDEASRNTALASVLTGQAGYLLALVSGVVRDLPCRREDLGDGYALWNKRLSRKGHSPNKNRERPAT